MRPYNQIVATRTMLPVHAAPTCSVAGAAEIVGSKWTVLIVHDLSEGPRRFTELERSCAGISPRTLAERLRWLETEEIVARQSYPESPPRVEYALTEKGRALLPVVHEMRRFGHDWLGCGVHDESRECDRGSSPLKRPLRRSASAAWPSRERDSEMPEAEPAVSQPVALRRRAHAVAQPRRQTLDPGPKMRVAPDEVARLRPRRR